MRYIGNKFFSHLINLDLLLNIFLQLVIGRLQFSDCFFQTIRQYIHTTTQYSNLILGMSLIFCLKIQFGHPFGNL